MCRAFFARRRIVVTTLLLLGAVLLLTQSATYFLFAEAAMPVAGIRQLVDYNGLCGARSRRQFAYVKAESWNAMTDSQKAALDAELKSLVPMVHYSHGDVPGEMIATRPLTDEERRRLEEYAKRGDLPAEHVEATKRQLETGRLYAGLKDGFGINWDLRSRGLLWMRCSSGIYFSPTGAEGIDAVFVWVLGFWIRVHTISHVAA